MNPLSSQSRKLGYLAGIIVLLIPVILLGRPSAPPSKAQPSGDPGGTLAEMRSKYDLGESTLGEVDPSSATMNLVLLGLRGVAANILSLNLEKYKDTKNWAQLRATTESIILLQPHFQKVWIYHGWNMAYNVSAEWDAVKDRYYWVKEGAKFYKRGAARNVKYPELYWYTGDTLGKKIGRCDEKRQFRKFFRNDPDPEVAKNGEGPDRDLNPDNKDNYEVAKVWFQTSNQLILDYGKEEHIMALILFWSYPARAQFDYASTLQSEGIFEEVTRQAWDIGYNDWTKVYGQKYFDSPGGDLKLESTDEDVPAGLDKDQQLNHRVWIGRYQDMCNYRYWRTRALAEREANTVEAHREIYKGHQALLNADTIEAEKLSFSGLQKFEKMLKDHPTLAVDDETIEEGLLGHLVWRDCLKLNGNPVPEHFPLEEIWVKEQGHMARAHQEYQRRFRSDQ